MDASTWLQTHWDEYLADLGTLIAYPSVSRETGNPDAPFGEACADVLDAALAIGARMGFPGRNHENYCGTMLWRGTEDAELGIFAHLDVVPEGIGWTYKPYEMTVLEDKAVGRGVSDNKGPGLIVLYALKYLQETGFTPRHSIRYFWGINEENGMKDIEYYVAHNPMPAFSFTPDASFPVCHGEKGVLTVNATFDVAGSVLVGLASGDASNIVPARAVATLTLDVEKARAALAGVPDVEVVADGTGCVVTAHGIAAHAAFPEGSRSAQVVLARALAGTGLLDEKAEHFMEASVKLFGDYNGAGVGIPYEDVPSGKLTHVGGMANLKDGVITQNINIRYPVTADRAQMKQVLTDTLAANGFTVTMMHDSAPAYMEKETPVIQALTEICNRVLGLSLEPYVMGGGTYARKLTNAVGYGPGIPGQESEFGPTRGGAHQPDEYVTFDQLRKGFLVYVEAIRAMDEMI